MNTTLKITLQLGLFCYLIFFQNMLPAQELDTQRLERDIDIAQSILGKLFGNEDNAPTYYRWPNGGSSVVISSPREGGRGYYVPGQGVVLQVSPPPHRWVVGRVGNAYGVYKNNAQTTPTPGNQEPSKDKIQELMKEFYLKYADLIGQLKPEDKIILVYDETDSEFDAPYIETQGQLTVTSSPSHQNTPKLKITGEIDRQSVAELKSGMLSEQDFFQKIIFHESQTDKKVAFEFEVLSGILETLFREGNSENVRCDDEVEFNYIDGFGVNYYLSLHTQHESDFHHLLGDGYNVYLRGRSLRVINDIDDIEDASVSINAKKKKDLQEVKQHLDSLKEVEGKKIQLALDEIEPKLQEYIIEYGRTLKSLKPDEVLVINVRINQWVHPFDHEEDEKENLMRLSVKKSVLTAYDNREISLDEAKNKVEITR